MKIETNPPADSYEAALTEEQRITLRATLLSGVSLAEAQNMALPWPSGPEQGRKPSITSLFRMRTRLRIAEQTARIEEAMLTARATRTLVRRLSKGTNERELLDQAVALMGKKLIDGCLGMENTTKQLGAAWPLLRREEMRVAEERLIAAREQAVKDKNELSWDDVIRMRQASKARRSG